MELVISTVNATKEKLEENNERIGSISAMVDMVLACNCYNQGSLDLKCDANGICICKPGYSGNKCIDCSQGYVKTSTGECQNQGNFV